MHQERFNILFLASLLKVVAVIDGTPRAKDAMVKCESLKDKSIRLEVMTALQSTDPEKAGLALMLMEGKASDVLHAIWSPIRPHGRELDTFYRDGQGE